MRVDERDDVALHLTGEDHAHDLHCLGSRHAQSAAKFTGDADSVKHGGDLRTTAVHNHRTQPRESKEDDVLREGALQCVVGHGVAAILDDDRRSAEALEPRQRLGQDRCLLLGAHVEYAEFSWT